MEISVLISKIFLILAAVLLISWLLSRGKMPTLKKRCNKISSQEELEKRGKYYREKMSIPHEFQIYFSFVRSKKDNKKDYKTAIKMGGAFSDKIGYNKYKIVITPLWKSDNEASLVHELSHIKRGDFERESRNIFVNFFKNIKFDIPINRKILPKYLELKNEN